MNTTAPSLVDVFAADHRHLTRGLMDVLDALRRGDVEAARERADDLDRRAGAHIELEEEVVYPYLATVLGREYVERLYHEHDVGRGALEALLEPAGPLGDAERERLVGELEVAMDHVLSCGTLVSHVTRLEPEEEARMLEARERFEARGRRWTELPERA